MNITVFGTFQVFDERVFNFILPQGLVGPMLMRPCVRPPFECALIVLGAGTSSQSTRVGALIAPSFRIRICTSTSKQIV